MKGKSNISYMTHRSKASETILPELEESIQCIVLELRDGYI
jgi:hypothetical protein